MIITNKQWFVIATPATGDTGEWLHVAVGSVQLGAPRKSLGIAVLGSKTILNSTTQA